LNGHALSLAPLQGAQPDPAGFHDREMAVTAVAHRENPCHGAALAFAGRQLIKRKYENSGRGLALAHGQLAEAMIVRNENATAFGREPKHVRIGGAGTSLLGVDNIGAAAAHFLHDFVGDAFIRKIKRHRSYSAAVMLSCAK